MTGGTEMEQVTAVHHAGMGGYIQEPFTESAFQLMIEGVFQSLRWRLDVASL
jgi:hypothetical protein